MMPINCKVTEYDKAFGQAIRWMRVQRGMPIAELAAHLGVSGAQVSKYETGKDRLTVGRAAMIAAALRCTPGDLHDDAAEALGLGDDEPQCDAPLGGDEQEPFDMTGAPR